MSDNTYLMYKDIPVLNFNVDTGEINVLEEKLVPFKFKNYIRYFPELTGNTSYDRTQMAVVIKHNGALIVNWLAHRTLVLAQKYAKKLYQAYRLVQRDDEITKAQLALTYKALSLQDNYWMTSDSTIKWDNINIRHNSLHKSVAQIQLHGVSLTLDGAPDPAAFSTNGAYAKAWHRDTDGSLWLYKSGNGNSEERIEVMCSDILDRCNVSHCHYELRMDDELQVCACPSMTSDKISIIDGGEIDAYYKHQNLNTDRELQKLDPRGYWSLQIVAYLLADRDKHAQNWGVYYKSDTMELLGLHPLFDHNNAFDVNVMQNENYGSHFLNKTLKENAIYGMKQIDFHFIAPITRDLFITDRQYKTFMKRADQLGIKTVKPAIDDYYIQCGGFDKYKEDTLDLIPKSVLTSDDSELIMSSMFKALEETQGTHNCYRRI